MHVRVGTDPEMFLRSKKTGYYISAHGLFPGTKDEPFKLEKGAMQVDGLALEFNIDAADSEDEFAGNIATVLEQINVKVAEVDPDLYLEFIPYATFEAKYFEELPEDCKILGCDPDYTYTGGMSTGPKDIMHRPFRTAAGHVHLGWSEGESLADPAHFEDCRFVSEHFFMQNIFQAPTHIEKTRLQYYGNNGAFRPKTYGVELRQPSNMWVKEEQTRREMYRTIRDEMKKVVG